MKLLLSLLLLCSILPSFVYSQKNLKEGFVVLNNGDTLTGYIDYKEWYKNPTGVLFTSSKDVEVRRYKENEIESFRVLNGESYKKYVVNLSMDSPRPNSFSEKDTSSRTEAVFLKILQQGKNLTLFSYTDDLKPRFYILQKNRVSPEELKNSIYMIDGRLVEEKQYHADLFALASIYLPGNKKIAGTINSSNYSAKTIAGICAKLNELTDSEAIQNTNADHSRFRFFAGAGVNQGTLKFSGFNHYTGNNSYPFYFPVIGIGVDIFVNPATRKLFLKNQLAATIFKTDGHAVVEYYEATENYFLKFKQINISLHSQLSYNLYNQPFFKWYIGAGAGMNLSWYPNNQEILIKVPLSGTTTTTVNDNYIEFIKTFWLNASIRTGFTLRKFDCSFLYLPKSSITKNTGSDITNSSIQLQVNYIFN